MKRSSQPSLFENKGSRAQWKVNEQYQLSFVVEGFRAKNLNVEIETIIYSFHDSLFGLVLIASAKIGICYIAYCEDRSEALKLFQKRFPKVNIVEGLQGDHQAALALLNGHKHSHQKIILGLVGTPFQLKVWQALLLIPAGKTTTYGELAKQIGKPKASRAVGTAIGKNPLAFIIPCHRVVQASGKIGGYMWGPDRKKSILHWELDSMKTSEK